MSTSRLLTTAGWLVLVSTTLTAAPGKATGYFRLHEVRSTFTFACAFSLPEPGATRRTHVVISDKGLDCESADRSWDPVEAVKAQVATQLPAFITFSFPSGGPVTELDGAWSSSDPVDSFAFAGFGTLTMTANTDTLTRGRYHLAEPRKFFDQVYQYDFSWDTPVLTGSMSGTPLPPGGGDVGTAYRKYLGAVVKGDVRAVRAASAADAARQIPDVQGEDARQFITLLRSFELKVATVTGGVQRDDGAALFVSGSDFESLPRHARVIMRREGGSWKVLKVGLTSPQ